MYKKGFVNIIIIIGMIAIIATAGYFVLSQRISSLTPLHSLISTTTTTASKTTEQKTDISNKISNNSTTTSFTTLIPHISIISPMSGSFGTKVTIVGSGFTKTGNTINFRIKTPGVVVNKTMNLGISSLDGTHLVFTVQKTVHLSAPGYNYDETFDLGAYDVIITNPNGHSNPIVFTITNTQITNPPPLNNRDCGKTTFIVIAGGPSGPYGEAANTRAREYFRINGLAVTGESGISRFVVESSSNTKQYWMKKIQDDGIGSTQYDDEGCDWVQ